MSLKNKNLNRNLIESITVSLPRLNLLKFLFLATYTPSVIFYITMTSSSNIGYLQMLAIICKVCTTIAG